MLSRHPLAVPAVLTTLAVLFFWPLTLAGKVLFWGTPLLQFFPWRAYAVEEYLAGRVPLWNPYAGFGAPLAANGQSAVFYPLNAVYFLLPVERATTATVLIHVFLAGLFTYGYSRALGLRPVAGLLSALIFMFGGYVVSRAGFLSVTSTVAWLPALFWLIEVLRRGAWTASLATAGLAAATGMLLLAGHVQLAAYGLLAAGAYLLFVTFVSTGAEGAAATRRRSTLLRAGAAFALGICLAAVQLLLTAELARQSVRQAGVDYDFGTGYSLYPGQLLGALIPDFFGNQAAGTWWGPGAPWEGVIYAGVLPFLLALTGIRHGGQLRLFFIGIAVAGLFLSLGRYNPAFPALFERVPGLALFQAPARFALWYCFAVAILAGMGMDALARDVRRAGYLGGVALGAGGGLLAMSLALQLPGFVESLAPSSITAVGSAGAWLLAAGLLLKTRGRWRPGLWQTAAAGLVFADLLLFGAPLNPATDAGLYQRETPQPAASIRAEAGLGRTYVSDADYERNRAHFFDFQRFTTTKWEELWEMRLRLVPNLATAERIYESHNYDPLRLDRAHRLQRAADQHALREGLLDIMGVKFVLSYGPEEEPAPSMHGETAMIAYVREPGPPRAYVATRVLEARNAEDAIAQLTSPGFDARAGDAVLEYSGHRIEFRRTGEERAKIVSYQPDRVVIDVASAGGLLVLSDAYYPGWRARVDGEERPVFPANAAFRGVLLPPGRRQVEFRYEPRSFQAGAGISLAALGAVASLAIVGCRRKAGHLAAGAQP